MKMKKNRISRFELRQIFLSTVPVLSGYIVLGIGFGMMLQEKGYGVPWAFAMSVLIYAGSMQYVAVDLLAGGASLIATAFTAIAVNARHLFYGISMIDRYRDMGKVKPYLIFAMTDETYSLISSDTSDEPAEKKRIKYFLISLFNHIYWIIGGILGVIIGALLPFSTKGVDFSLTALFITVFIDQWLASHDHASAVIGVGCSAAALLIFGADNFLIPAMLLITLALTALRFIRKRKERIQR